MTRNEYIDFLRFLGLSLIIFAHVEPPYILFQLRNFDVPLMVIVSALSFSLSNNSEASFLKYIWSRIKRLLFPVWVFLACFFGGVYFLDPSSSDLNKEVIIESFALQEGIGYVWIIRVFLLVAISAPLVFSTHKKFVSNRLFFGILLITYLLYELAYVFVPPLLHGEMSVYFESIFFYLVPYSLLFSYGLRVSSISTRNHILIFLAALTTFIFIALILYKNTGTIVPTQDYKYPPRIYYLSFALVGCQFVWLTGGYVWGVLSKLSLLKKFIIFVGNNSLWIYLWHIPMVKYIDANFIVKYIIIYTLAAVCVFVQRKIVEDFIAPKINSRTKAKNIKIILTG